MAKIYSSPLIFSYQWKTALILRKLITNQFKIQNYDQPLTTIVENAEYKERLKPIFKAFRETYSIVGRIDDPSFQINLDEDA